MAGEYEKAVRWTVIKKINCKWCDMAVKELEALGQLVTKVDIADAPGVLSLMLIQGLNTVPQVFMNQKLVGGYNDLKRYLNGNAAADSTDLAD